MPLVVPRGGYTPSRPSCIECCEKHLGAAYVLLTEARDLPAGQAGGYAYRLRAIGHLFEAEDESQQWPDLHNTIRQARKAYQTNGTMPDWEAIESILDETRANVQQGFSASRLSVGADVPYVEPRRKRILP